MLSQGPQEKANKDVIASILSYFQFQRGKNISAIEKITPVLPVGFVFQGMCLPPVIKKLALLKCLRYIIPRTGIHQQMAIIHRWGDQLALKVELKVSVQREPY